MPVYRGAGGAGDATNDATVTAVQAAATSAATSATNAANSATAAANSATGAATSATDASNSATTAAGQATTAAGSATNAATFATNSSLSADDAADSALEAQQYASEANDAEVAASLSASNAATSATNAATSATSSASSAASALAIYGNTTAMNNAVAAAQLAETNAETAETNAETAATTATNAASTATTQATNAAASAVAADADASAASIDANEAQAAATAAQAAVSSATAIYGSIEDIQQAEVNSEANRDAAAASAGAASTSATTATTQAGIATTQATNAATSAAQASAVALGNEPVRHSVRPSLLLDFANTKTLDPRITFTRASTGTFYDGKTVAKAEENLLVNSQTFDTNWVAERVTITANSVASPDLTTTAETITATATTGTHLIQQASSTAGYSIVSGLAYTISIFAKKNTNDFLQITTFSGVNSLGSGRANFNLATGVVGTVDGGTSTITDTGSGWYRCTYTVTASASGSVAIYFGLITTSTAGRFESYAGVGTESIYIWGAQLEQRSSVTAYTATTTAPITNYIPALQTAAAGVARFEHNPVTGESLGLEIEEQRTNLLLRSEEIDNAYWTKANASITANAVVAPDGNLTADSLVENTAATGHNISSTAFTSGLTSAISYTFSVYVKPAGRSWAILEMGGALGGGYGWFDLSTGTLGTQTQLSGTSTITAVGNGWYRISITDTSTSTGSAATKCNVYATTGNNVISYTGDGFSGISVWGAQLEAGSFATSYIATVASQVTRSADSASMTGTNISSWYRADEGTVYQEIRSTDTATTAIGLGNFNSSSNFTGFGRSGASWYYYVNYVVGTNMVSGRLFDSSSGYTVGSYAKMVGAFKVGQVSTIAINGVALDGTTTLPSAELLAAQTVFIGGRQSVLGQQYVKKIAFYPRKLTNAELQSLTVI